MSQLGEHQSGSELRSVGNLTTRRQPGRGASSASTPPVGPTDAVALSTVWPEIFDAVLGEDRALAEQTLRLPLLSVDPSDLAEAISRNSSGVLDFLLVSGLALKQTMFVQRRALELLGPGDLLAPPLDATRQLESRAVSCYVGLGPVSLMVIDGRFVAAARRWPGMTEILHERLGRQTHWASMQSAMLHLPRTEERLIALFADLAERFGRVSTAGILVDLPLTHEVIGGLIASSRPSVSLGIQALTEQGLIKQHDADRWTLSPGIMAV